jgi:glyceraldehyde 3-phosphate dehydrogenase
LKDKISIGINGFGRIGRSLFRLLYHHPSIEVVAINDMADAKTLAHLLTYDSIHGVFPHKATASEECLFLEDRKFAMMRFSSPKEIPWGIHKVDIVIEATGKFKDRETLTHHLKNGAKKVILSVPPNDDDIKMIIQGVNHEILTQEDHIVSNASCTTNNAAPMLKVIHDHLGVTQAYISTIHSYTTDQSLHDQPHRDLRRSRAAGQSIVPTTTGAAKALTKIFPDLKDVIGGCGIRVPVPNGSLTDMTLNVSRSTTIEEVNQLFKNVASTYLSGILHVTEDPIVSIDIIGNSHSCVLDAEMTSVIGGKLVKLIGWYDNERGYSNRIIDLISQLNKFI